MTVHHLAPDVFTIDGVLTEAECAAWLARAEAEGFDEAPVSTASGFFYMPSVRNNTRAMFDDRAAVEALWARLAPWIPPVFDETWQVVGLNERLRIYRYRPGQYFRPHFDGAYERTNGERSQLTVLIYLGAAEIGGATTLRPVRGAPEVRVETVPGRALVFRHAILHAGEPVEAGLKHVLRTDVMYRLIPGAL